MRSLVILKANLSTINLNIIHDNKLDLPDELIKCLITDRDAMRAFSLFASNF